jgi:hypothetical protein
MKRLLIVAATMIAAVGAYAQGTVNFNNRVTTAGIDAPVLTFEGAKIDGAAGFAQLFAGADANSLVAVGAPVNFRTGAAAGYFNGGSVDAGLAGGATASLQVRAWLASQGSTWAAASASAGGFGSSAVLNGIVLGNPNGAPPTVPADLVGLAGFSLSQIVPEPTTLALGVLGAAALLIRRRK